MADAESTRRKGLLWKVPLGGFCALLAVLSVLLWFSARWYVRRYGDVGFDSILFTLRFHVAVAEKGQLWSFFRRVLLRSAAFSALFLFLLFGGFRGRRLRIGRRTLWPFGPWSRLLVTLAVCLPLLHSAADRFGAVSWFRDRSRSTTLYEDECVDAASVRISFPERKRNLICLYIESCETTFFSREQGGALPACGMPELFALTQEGTSFSPQDAVGGWEHVQGADWTAAAMVALTTGLPLSMPVQVNSYDAYDRFLPGARALGDVLHEAGYRQALIIGSDQSFGGRGKLYLQHGTDEVLDYGTAIRKRVIPPDYRVWWGLEDRKLYPWAKKEIRRIADEGKPFAVTVLTADTHAPDGFVCPLCPTNSPYRYANVFSCASRQAGDFVNWLRQQDFYENTTVFVCGDHISMAPGLFSEQLPGCPKTSRFVYNCILNAVPTVPEERTKHRLFTPMDFYPTVLAAIGCSIEGDRLGLGTDLFSGRPTLLEKMGLKQLNRELRRQSDYYFERFVLGRPR